MTGSLRFFAVLAAAATLAACSNGAQSPIPSSSRPMGSTAVPFSQTGPSLAWSPGGLFHFGNETSQVFTLTNSGGSSTGVLSVLLGTPGTIFAIEADSCTGTALGPKQSCSVTVQDTSPGTPGENDLEAIGRKAGAIASVVLFGQ